MDLLRARVVLRERSLVDVFDLAVRFCRAHFRLYARLSLVTWVPAFIVTWALAGAFGWLSAWAAALALAPLTQAPFTLLASQLVFADDVRVRDVLRSSARATFRVLGAGLVQATAVGLSVPFLGLPWLWLGTALLFLPEAVLLERQSVRAAVSRSQRLVNAHLGAAMPAMVLLLALPVGAAFFADLVGRETLAALFEVRVPSSAHGAATSALALAGFWLVLPLRATARFLVYIDLRTRSEGWDIQTRFAAIVARNTAAESREIAA